MLAPTADAKAFQLETLALLPSWECDIACHHCVFSSSPAVKGRLPIAHALATIEALVRASSVRRVTLSGGEPFLDFEYMTKLAAGAAAGGLEFRIVSNCTFAATADVALEKLRQLQSVGLESLCISWDEFHNTFVDPARVRHALRACRKLGISARLTVVVTKAHDLGTSVAKLGDEAFEVPITQVRCLSVGRASKKVKSGDLLEPPEWDQHRACRNDFDTLALTHDGSVYPCCAVGGFTKGIRLGSIFEESIALLLERRDNGFRWTTLSAQGPDYFLKYASPSELALLGIEAKSHDCVKCHKLFSSPIGATLEQRASACLQEQVSQILSRQPFVVSPEKKASSKASSID